MGFAPAIHGHMGFESVGPEHKDFGPIVLGQEDFEPVALGHEDLGTTAAGLDPDLVLAKVDPVDMYIRVVVAWVGLAIVRANLAAAKDVPRTLKVGLAKT